MDKKTKNEAGLTETPKPQPIKKGMTTAEFEAFWKSATSKGKYVAKNRRTRTCS